MLIVARLPTQQRNPASFPAGFPESRHELRGVIWSRNTRIHKRRTDRDRRNSSGIPRRIRRHSRRIGRTRFRSNRSSHPHTRHHSRRATHRPQSPSWDMRPGFDVSRSRRPTSTAPLSPQRCNRHTSNGRRHIARSHSSRNRKRSRDNRRHSVRNTPRDSSSISPREPRPPTTQARASTGPSMP